MDQWVTIYTGPPWQVDLHRGRLESEGITVFVPDASTKVVNPFVTGLNPFSAELRVPSSSVQRASELLAGALDGEGWGDTDLDALALGSAYDGDDGAGEASESSNSSHDDGAEDETTWTGEEVESLATRTRWAAVMGLTIPFALMYGAFYLVAARESGLRSPSHRLTLWAIGYSILVLSLLVLFVFTRP